MHHFIIWHDNGVRGQFGYSEADGDLDSILKSYEEVGITVYKVEILPETQQN